MKRFNHFFVGFVPGLIFPVLFMWIYLNRFYPADLTFLETLKQMYPSILLGKLLLLSVMPNLALVFVFYKTDSYKIASGMIVSAMPYFVGSIMML